MSMVSAPRGFQRFYAAVPGAISVAREELAEFAAGFGASEEELERVSLALSEAVTNAVEHAYDEAGGEIEVIAAPAGNDLSVLVADRGQGLRRGSPSEGLGLGLALIYISCDGLTLARRAGGGLEVRMRFAIGALRGRLDERQARGSVASAERAASPTFSTTT